MACKAKHKILSPKKKRFWAGSPTAGLSLVSPRCSAEADSRCWHERSHCPTNSWVLFGCSRSILSLRVAMKHACMLTALLLAASVSCALGQWPNSNPTLPGWGEPVGIDCQCSDVSPRIANTETVNTTCAAQKDNCDQPFMLNSVKELAEGERTLSQADTTTTRRQDE